MTKNQSYYNSLPECSIIDYEVIPYLEAVLLWCGVEREDLQGVLNEVNELSSGIYQHPYIPCLQKKTRVLELAITQGDIRAVREHGYGGEIEILDDGTKCVKDHVARNRRHFWIQDLKEFISSKYPNDKPKTLFNDDERKTPLTQIQFDELQRKYDSLLLEKVNYSHNLMNFKQS
ncbi:hypothetical protein ACWA5Z_10795 [Testudinibacter sp. P80/BLE/0925]|uniref:hypothetical protein n=1 Tax=Testudinibacter sp. TW-1 TaxID=3417757 RepID=UPI003D36001C